MTTRMGWCSVGLCEDRDAAPPFLSVGSGVCWGGVLSFSMRLDGLRRSAWTGWLRAERVSLLLNPCRSGHYSCWIWMIVSILDFPASRFGSRIRSLPCVRRNFVYPRDCVSSCCTLVPICDVLKTDLRPEMLMEVLV